MGYILLWIFAIYGMIRFVFGIGKGITSFVKGMFLGAIDGYKHLRNTQITFRKKNKDVKDIEKNVHDKRCLITYIKDGHFLLPRK